MGSNDLSPINRVSLAFISLCMIRCKLLLEVHAFTSLQLKRTRIACRCHHQFNNSITLLHASIDNDSENNTCDDDQNDAILNELRDKKKEAFGTDIPSNDELQQAAKNAENAFLAAMLEQTQNFKEIKSELGGDAAVTEFRRRIQEGDEAQRLEDANAASKASREESIDTKLFVQQMEEGITGEIEEENHDDSWQ